eukprot:8584817-Alexandrium_andersonii.AAC.1
MRKRRNNKHKRDVQARGGYQEVLSTPGENKGARRAAATAPWRAGNCSKPHAAGSSVVISSDLVAHGQWNKTSLMLV